MKYTRLLFLLLLPLTLLAQDFPKRTDKLVNDYTSTLSKQELIELITLLEGYERESSIEIAVVLIPTLDGYEIAQYTFDLGEKWGIGKGGTDNGALVLVSRGDRKIWIATGYGLEGALPDALVSRIISNEILPRFKQDDYFGGLKAGSLAIIQATYGEYEGRPEGTVPAGQGVGIIVMVLLVFLMIWGIRAMQVKEYAKVNHLGFWAAWALLNSAATKHGGAYGTFSGGRGFGGGGFSGGGGGFGGFGGGSFGGGGAGGSW